MAVLNFVTSHYPERLGMLLLVDTPWIFNGFWAMASPFLSSATVSKILFIKGSDVSKTLQEHIDKETLEKDFGGENTFVYEHEKYMEMLLKEEEEYLNLMSNKKV
jgi:hypothetical protein